MTGRAQRVKVTTHSCDGVPTIALENDLLRAEIVPAIGGRVISLVHRSTGREFLWRNSRLTLRPCPPGAEYDPNFYGGMDELLPNDLPEAIDGVPCPDHGELWTLALTAETAGDCVTLSGRLPRFGLEYRRSVRLDGNRLLCDYCITNATGSERRFMWKLHAALAVQPGDRILCPAATARAADPAWSRRSSAAPFTWPEADGLDFSLVPAADGTTEFLFLYDLTDSCMALEAKDGARLECRFDRAVFPCCWYFASHGAMDGAFTGVLEPCTNMPLSVNDAARDGYCARLQPGESLVTSVTWTAEYEGQNTAEGGR